MHIERLLEKGNEIIKDFQSSQIHIRQVPKRTTSQANHNTEFRTIY